MATYNNSYQYKVTPNTPDLRGLTTNYSNDGQTNLGGIGLGDLYELDYDRNKIEQIFNQGTDARYALMQKENQIAQNQYANNQFANQQTAIESLRQQRNEQISSGMARGLNAAQEQGTILGLQQDASAGALELANQQQLEADKIATEYADNVVKALEQSNAVKQAMASIAAQLYEADMLGYTGELGYLGQMDANASDRYGYELGLEGTKYSADKNLEGTKYTADKNYAGAKYAADKSYAAAQLAAAASAGGGGASVRDTEHMVQEALDLGRSKGLSDNDLINFARTYVQTANPEAYGSSKIDPGLLWTKIDEYAVGIKYKGQTKAAYEQSLQNQRRQNLSNISHWDPLSKSNMKR